MKPGLIPIILTALAVAACVSPKEQDEATCQSYGIQPTTAEFATCLEQESWARNYGFDAAPPAWIGETGPGWNGDGWYWRLTQRDP